MSTSEVETRARTMGWRPREEFIAEGRPEKNWVDAETYVERGDNTLPLLQANNKKLSGKVTELERQTQQLTAQLASASEAIEALKDLRTTLNVDRAKQQKVEILDQIKEAKTSGDVDTEVALTDKLSEVNAALKEAAKPEVKTKPADSAPQLTPETQEWADRNPWFGNGPDSDAGKTGYAMGLAKEWVAAGKRTGTKEFFDHVDAKISEIFDPNRGRREAGSKVDSTSNSERTDGGTTGKTFADLPREAKEAFEKNVKKLVGPGKVYKDRAALQKIYVEQYDWS